MSAWEPIDISYSDGYTAFARWWSPPNPRGAVLYLHGIQSHGLWFEASAQRLADAGFVVLLPDRRGSGRNQAQRGHTPSKQRLIDDVAQCCADLHHRTGFAQTHLLGVSWGGKLGLAFHQRFPERAQSLTLLAPGLFPKVDLPRSQKLRVGWSALTGGRALFDIPLQQVELFTENPVRQAFIRDDQLALRQVTAGFMIASRRLDHVAGQAQAAHSGPPLCLFLGGQDRIIDNTRTREFVRRLPWAGRRIVEYQSAHHTLEFETDPEPFFRDLVGWLSAQSDAGR